MQYPEEKSTADYTITPRWRGTHRMATDEQGRSKCVACGLCPQICPANCIKLVPGEDEEGTATPHLRDRRVPLRLLRYCQESARRKRSTSGCTTKTRSIPATASCTTSERLMSQTHPVSTLWDPADPRGE
jgi:NADH-quinone oxidoreductase subunit I